MRLEVAKPNGQLVWTDVDERLILADSQFDYSGNGTGWKFMARDSKTSELTTLRRRQCEEDSPTADLYRVGSDTKCWIGRDHAHPGYAQAPSLVWRVTHASIIELSCELALLVPNTVSRGHVSVWVDARQICSQLYRFPEIVRISATLHVWPGESVIVTFNTEKIIDNITTLYFAWLTDAGRASRFTRQPSAPIVQSIVDEAWQARYHEIERMSGLSDVDVVALAHAPFDHSFDITNRSRQIVQDNRTRAQAGRSFGLPRYFGVKARNG